ncbi:MAG: o-succinylbenzoate synthase [Bacteroidales bacterium]|nr:o-succinylbenzoate synthase [Bacteroidales bacterium]
MVHASYTAYPLIFVRPAGTSRGVLKQKPCWFIQITGEDGVSGLGEVSVIPNLSVEDPDEIEIRIDHICKLISIGEMDPKQPLPTLPGVQFALETAMLDLKQGGERLLFPSEFTKGSTGIRTNGLIWMGVREFMISQIREKMQLGFTVLKLKVGALDLQVELEVLKWIRSEFGTADLEIRLDANGAWEPGEAEGKMQKFARFGIHSIEQPIASGQAEAMAELCNNPVIPVALDEELIGITGQEAKRALLAQINPSYIILKPGLLGGFSMSGEWIRMAEELKIGWWITSALESSIGLNAIAQWTWQLGVSRPQGLGTGALYTNNIPSPLQMSGEQLWYRPEKGWDLSDIIIS